MARPLGVMPGHHPLDGRQAGIAQIAHGRHHLLINRPERRAAIGQHVPCIRTVSPYFMNSVLGRLDR
jgi:hypothetical protein